MSESFSPRSSVILHAIAITSAIAFLSGHLQLKIDVPQPRVLQVQVSSQR